jgi:hypothetical protein
MAWLSLLFEVTSVDVLDTIVWSLYNFHVSIFPRDVTFHDFQTNQKYPWSTGRPSIRLHAE